MNTKIKSNLSIGGNCVVKIFVIILTVTYIRAVKVYHERKWFFSHFSPHDV
jgi:hypothetical protein